MFDEHTLIFVASKIEISYKVKKGGILPPRDKWTVIDKRGLLKKIAGAPVSRIHVAGRRSVLS